MNDKESRAERLGEKIVYAIALLALVAIAIGAVGGWAHLLELVGGSK